MISVKSKILQVQPALPTLGVAVSVALFSFIPFIGCFLCICLFSTSFWWLPVLYTIWLSYDRNISKKGGRPITSVQKWRLWKYIFDYMPIHLTLASNFKVHIQRNYLFCCFPHGALPMGTLASLIYQFHQLYPNFKIYGAALNLLYFVPLLRDIALAMSGVSCSKESLDYILSKTKGGHAVILFPGGVAEMALTKPKTYKFVVKKRKGFVKIALKNFGISLVPVITFGQNDLYDRIETRWIQKYCRYIPSIFYGRLWIPFKVPLTTVLGTPIEVAKTENPSNQQIDELHDLFMQQLVDLFNEHKYKYLENPESQILELE